MMGKTANGTATEGRFAEKHDSDTIVFSMVVGTDWIDCFWTRKKKKTKNLLGHRIYHYN
jgi:hypothetical protein